MKNVAKNTVLLQIIRMKVNRYFFAKIKNIQVTQVRENELENMKNPIGWSLLMTQQICFYLFLGDIN